MVKPVVLRRHSKRRNKNGSISSEEDDSGTRVISPLKLRAVNLPQFDGTDYALWVLQVRPHMISMRLKEFIQDLKEEEDSLVAHLSASAYEELDQAVMAVLLRSLKPNILPRVVGATTAKEVWMTLELEFKGSERVRASYLEISRRAYEELRMREGESLLDYYTRFISTVTKLRDCGERLGNGQINRKLLRTLSKSFQSIVVLLQNKDGIEETPLQEVLGALRAFESENLEIPKSIDVKEEQVLAAQSSKQLVIEEKEEVAQAGAVKINQSAPRRERNFQRGNFKAGDRRTCFTCGKPGHLAHNCPGEREIACQLCGGPGHGARNCNKWRNVQDVSSSHRAHSAIEDYEEEEWVVDSGASSHMSGNKGIFLKLKPHFCFVKIANGWLERGVGIGEVHLIVGGKEIVLKDVLYVPKLKMNLLSIGKLTKTGGKVVFTDDKCQIWQERIFIEIANHSGCYTFKSDTEKESCAFTMVGKACAAAELWHMRLGHAADSRIQEMSTRRLVNGLPKVKFISENACEGCLLGKMSRKPFAGNLVRRAHQPLELMHIDLCGPINPISCSRNAYFMVVVDDYSRYCWVKFLRHKNQVREVLPQLIMQLEKEFVLPVKEIRSDRGGEFTSDALNEYFMQKGIKRQLTAPYSPQQNGVAERKNRSLMEAARSMIFAMKVPRRFWAEAVAVACYVQNRLPTSANKGEIPLRLLTGRIPTVHHLRSFGCQVFVKLPLRESKLEAKSKKMMFIGYSEASKAYKCYDFETKRVVISRDVVFMEEQPGWPRQKEVEGENWAKSENFSTAAAGGGFWPSFGGSGGGDGGGKSATRPILVLGSESLSQERPVLAGGGGGGDFSPTAVVNSPALTGGDSDGGQTATQPILVPGVDSLTQGRPVVAGGGGGGDSHVFAENGFRQPSRVVTRSMARAQRAGGAIEVEPVSYKEALNDDGWVEAMRKEIRSIQDNRTWEVVPATECKKRPISLKWVYKLKRNLSGEVIQKKARLVARGFSQIEGVDYQDSFAPTTKFDTIRLLLSLCASEGWVTKHLDINSAFLYGELMEETFVSYPPGFKCNGREGGILRLKKALYGLKQAAHEWNKVLDQFFGSLNFKKSVIDQALYYKFSGERKIFVSVYVDDLMCVGSDEEMLNDFAQQLGKRFKCKDLGIVQNFLGLEVKHGRKGIWVTQRNFAEQLLRDAGMETCNSNAIPMNVSERLKNDESEKLGDGEMYRRIVGKLLFLVKTRPDLSFVVCQLAKYTQSPKVTHEAALKKVLRYVRGTKELGLWYSRNRSTKLEAHTDSDWANDLDGSLSVSGNLICWNGGAVSWSSRKQSDVAKSTAEAEYMALSEAASSVVWFQQMLKDLRVKCDLTTTIKCDNQSAIHMSNHQTDHRRTRHIRVNYHYVRELVGKKLIDVVFCRSAEQMADALTKPQSIARLEEWRTKLKLKEYNSNGGD